MNRNTADAKEFAPLQEDTDETACSPAEKGQLKVTSGTNCDINGRLEREMEGAESGPVIPIPQQDMKPDDLLSQHTLDLVDEAAHNISASALEAALLELSREEDRFEPTLSTVSELRGSTQQTLRLEDLAASQGCANQQPLSHSEGKRQETVGSETSNSKSLAQHLLQDAESGVGSNLSLSQYPLKDSMQGSSIELGNGASMSLSQGLLLDYTNFSGENLKQSPCVSTEKGMKHEAGIGSGISSKSKEDQDKNMSSTVANGYTLSQHTIQEYSTVVNGHTLSHPIKLQETSHTEKPSHSNPAQETASSLVSGYTLSQYTVQDTLPGTDSVGGAQQGNLSVSQYSLPSSDMAKSNLSSSAGMKTSQQTVSESDATSSTIVIIGNAKVDDHDDGKEKSETPVIRSRAQSLGAESKTSQTTDHLSPSERYGAHKDQVCQQKTDDNKPNYISAAQREELLQSLGIEVPPPASEELVFSSDGEEAMVKKLFHNVADGFTISNKDLGPISSRSDPEALYRSSKDGMAASSGSDRSAPAGYNREDMEQLSVEDQYDQQGESQSDHPDKQMGASYSDRIETWPSLDRVSQGSERSVPASLADRVNALMAEAPVSKRYELADGILESQRSQATCDGEETDPDVRQVLQRPRPANFYIESQSPKSDVSESTTLSRASTEYQDLPTKLPVAGPNMSAIPEAFMELRQIHTPQQNVSHGSAEDSPGVSSDVEEILKKYDSLGKKAVRDIYQLAASVSKVVDYHANQQPSEEGRESRQSSYFPAEQTRDTDRLQCRPSSQPDENQEVLNNDHLDRERDMLEGRTSDSQRDSWNMVQSNLDYSTLAKDLDEIQDHLSAMRKDTSFQSGSSVTSERVDEDGKKKYSWDYGADLGYNSQGRFVSSVSNHDELGDRIRPEGQSTRVQIQPLLTSDIVPLEMALDIMQATEEATASKQDSTDDTAARNYSRDDSRYQNDGNGDDSDTPPLSAQDLDTSKVTSGNMSRSRSQISKLISDADLSATYSDLQVRERTQSLVDTAAQEAHFEDDEIRNLSARNDSVSSFEPKYRSLSANPSSEKYFHQERDQSLLDHSYARDSHTRSKSVDPNALSPHRARVGSPERGTAGGKSLSERVYNILTSSSPHRQAYRYLQEAEDREYRGAGAPTRGSPYIANSGAYDSLSIHPEKRNFRQADFLRGRHSNDSFRTLSPDRSQDNLNADSFSSPKAASHSRHYTGSTPVGYAPFSTFNQMENFLATQLDKMSNIQFDRSMDRSRSENHDPRQVWGTPKQTRASPQFLHHGDDRLDVRRSREMIETDYSGTYRPRTTDGDTRNKTSDTEDKLYSSREAEGISQSVASSGQQNRSSQSKSNSPPIRPYKPPGSQELYYIESDSTSVANSETTVESTHQGSDDALPPTFPAHVLGTREEVHQPSGGIYAKRHSGPKAGPDVDILSTIHENSHAEKSLGESSHSKNSNGSNKEQLNSSQKKTEEWLKGQTDTKYDKTTADWSDHETRKEIKAPLPLPPNGLIAKSPVADLKLSPYSDRYVPVGGQTTAVVQTVYGSKPAYTPPAAQSKDSSGYRSSPYESALTGARRDTVSPYSGGSHRHSSSIQSPHGGDFGRKPGNYSDGGFATSSPAYSGSSAAERSITPTGQRLEQRDFSPLLPDQDDDDVPQSNYFTSSKMAPPVDPVSGLPTKYQFADGSRIVRSPTGRRSQGQRSPSRRSHLSPSRSPSKVTGDGLQSTADSAGRTPYRRRVEMKRMIDDTDTSSDNLTPRPRSPTGYSSQRSGHQATQASSDINQLWQKFKSVNRTPSENNARVNHEELISLLSNPVQHFVRRYQKELQGEKAKTSNPDPSPAKKSPTAWQIPAESLRKSKTDGQSRSANTSNRSGMAWDISANTSAEAENSKLKGADQGRYDQKPQDASPSHCTTDANTAGRQQEKTPSKASASVQTSFSHEKDALRSKPGEARLEGQNVSVEIENLGDEQEKDSRDYKHDTSAGAKSQGKEVTGESSPESNGRTINKVIDGVAEKQSVSSPVAPGKEHIPVQNPRSDASHTLKSNSQSSGDKSTTKSKLTKEEAKKLALKMVLKKLIEKETQTSDKEESAQKVKNGGAKQQNEATQTSDPESKKKSSTNKCTQSLSGTKQTLSPQTNGRDLAALSKEVRISALAGQEETLSSIPEDSTLSTDLTTSSADSDGMLFVTRKRHLPDDPKLIKLQQKIQKQKEKYLRDKLREQKRKDKIALLEQLLRHKGKMALKHTEIPSTSDNSTTSSDLQVSKITAGPRKQILDSTDSDTLVDTTVTATPSKSPSGHRSVQHKGAVLSDEGKGVCSCQPSRSPKPAKHPSPKQKKTKANTEMKLKLQEIDYSKYDQEDQYDGKTRGIARQLKATTPTKPKKKSRQHVTKGSSKHAKSRPNTKDFGNMYPSPMVADKRKYKHGATVLVSEGIQTEFAEKLKQLKSVEEQGVVSVPVSPPKQKRMSAREVSAENQDPQQRKVDLFESGGLAWFVPLKESRPWRKPLSERQDLDIWSQPQLDTLEQGPLEEDDNTEYHMTKGQVTDAKLRLTEPTGKMTLQEAFLKHKRNFISKSRERQRYIILRAQERRIQTVHQQERQRLFGDGGRKLRKGEAHPYSENLHFPKRRFMSKKEMKEITQRKYKNLPEVVEKMKLQKRQEQYKTNRLKAKLFKKKVLNTVLNKKNLLLNP